jgi:hypothetical protein
MNSIPSLGEQQEYICGPPLISRGWYVYEPPLQVVGLDLQKRPVGEETTVVRVCFAKIFNSPSHQILRHMHKAFNIDKNN